MLGKAFGDYLAKWNSAETIMANGATYADETTKLLGALQNRIDKENKELFTLLQR